MNPMLLPLVAAQGLWLRATIKPAPEAGGATNGTVPGVSGAPLHLAVVGDSTAAGCGATHHTEGFAAALAQRLAADTGRPVAWETVGRFGATARRIRHQLVPRLGDDLDLVVLLAGANDVMAGRSPAQWRDDLTAILTDLTGRARQVVVAGNPPFTKFPALPATLARYLSERADTLDQVSRRICAQNPDRTAFISSPAGQPPPEFFGSDRFHPSALGYRLWAEDLAARLTR
ncbi:SGNH/GDSL hydrolase family protein [Phytohabitans kaempferiae]|uniref:SGNH/GDSL hydrolase family protein n=1 Tax=Phytohabitans kaempferiae TaxID=1620943 RepID=A0ABV6M3T8_9ACTN